MTEIQAVRLPKDKAAQLGPLRTLGGLEVHETDKEIWLRVRETSEEIQTALKSLPAATAFRVLDDGQLCQWGNLVPHGFLPAGPWESLSQWMTVKLPSAALAGRLTNRIPLQLVRDSQPRDANLLLTSLNDWLAYGRTAPQVRLDRWQFAVSVENEVLIRGTPLPPIPGQQFIEEHGIAIPCGWHWSPAVDGEVLAQAFALSDCTLLLWRAEGSIERIAREQFVRATRSAIRLSAEAAHV